MSIADQAVASSSGRLIMAAIVVAAFGPYVIPSFGIRIEHVLIYAVMSILLMRVALSPRMGTTGSGPALAAIILLCAAVWTALSSLGSGSGMVPFGQRVAGFENFLQPAALFAVVALLASYMDEPQRRHALRTVILVLIVMLCLNSMVSLASIHFDTWPLVKYFATGSNAMLLEGQSSWERSAVIGRYSGIFNQPIEAGLAYSLGVIGWAYLQGGRRRVPMFHWVMLGALVLGGALSVSKTFLFVGFPLGAFYWALITGRHQVLSVRTAFVAATGSVALVLLLANWKAAEYALRYFKGMSTGDAAALIELLTAGRYAGDVKSTVQIIFEDVAAAAPVAGMGFGSFPTLESAYLEYFALGGAGALALYLTVLLIVCTYCGVGMLQKRSEAFLLAAVAILVIVAGLGGPVLTINRASVALVLVIGLAMTLIPLFPPKESTCYAHERN